MEEAPLRSALRKRTFCRAKEKPGQRRAWGCPEGVGRVNVLDGRGSQRGVWGPEGLYFSRAPAGKEAGEDEEGWEGRGRETPPRRPLQGPLQGPGRDEGAQTGLLAPAPPPPEGVRAATVRREAGPPGAARADRGQALPEGRVRFTARTSSIQTVGPPARSELCSCPAYQGAVLEHWRGEGHSASRSAPGVGAAGSGGRETANRHSRPRGGAGTPRLPQAAIWSGGGDGSWTQSPAFPSSTGLPGSPGWAE